jgi:hypothetical protein
MVMWSRALAVDINKNAWCCAYVGGRLFRLYVQRLLVFYVLLRSLHRGIDRVPNNDREGSDL